MLKTSQSFLASAHSEYVQNSRLRIGVWLIALIIAVSLVTELRHRRDAARAAFYSEQERYTHLKKVGSKKSWPAQVTALKGVYEELVDKLWVAETRGLAQAKVQVWLDKILADLAIQQVRTEVEKALDVRGYKGVWLVRARISGAIEAYKIPDLLLKIENNATCVGIETLKITARAQTSFTMTLSIYFRSNET